MRHARLIRSLHQVGSDQINVDKARMVLQGSGATFPALVYKQMFFVYQFLQTDTTVKYNPIGSGPGIREIKERKVDTSQCKHIVVNVTY